ncbi:Hint domain-containing protein [Chondromyces crocatus]|nr:Hint domain-containing protein [Chondromyces crocatus]
MYAANGVELKEYRDEGLVGRRYTGGTSRYINTTFRTTLFDELGGTSQTTDALMFFKWTKVPAKKRARPLYPTFGSNPNVSLGKTLKPNAGLTNCNLYDDKGVATSTFYVNGYCESSCYTPEQEVLFPDGYQRIDVAVDALRPTMITLTPDATLDDLQFMESPVDSYTAELRDTDHVIFEIVAESGGRLRLTDQHPVILGDGKLVQARALKVGDTLLREDGALDPITSVEVRDHHGKVYNLRPKTTDRVSNLLIAQGYVVGSSRYQNDDIGYVNRTILTEHIPEALIPE